jgi:hypothetical protein
MAFGNCNGNCGPALLCGYPLEWSKIAPNHAAGDSEYVMAYGMPEPVFVAGKGWRSDWFPRAVQNWCAVLFWVVAGYLLFASVANTGATMARMVNQRRQMILLRKLRRVSACGK